MASQRIVQVRGLAGGAFSIRRNDALCDLLHGKLCQSERVKDTLGLAFSMKRGSVFR